MRVKPIPHRDRIRVWLRWTWRKKLGTLVVLVLLPIVLAANFAVQESIAQVKTSILQSELETAKQAATYLDVIIKADKMVLAEIATDQDVRSLSSTPSSSLIKETLSAHPAFLNIYAADRSGKVFASAVWGPDEELDISGSDYFRQVVYSGAPTVSGTRQDSQTQDMPTTFIAVPIKDETGAVTGIVAGELSLIDLGMNLGIYSGSDFGNVLVVGTDGSTLSYPDWRFVKEGTSFANAPALQDALRGVRGSLESVNWPSGESVLVGYCPVPSTGWALAVVQPTDLAYAVVWESIRRSMIIQFFGLCIAGLLALLLLNWMSHSMTTLRSKVENMMGEVLPMEKPEEVSGDELEQLAQRFESLTTLLNAKTTQLTEFKTEIEKRNNELRLLSRKNVRAEEQLRKMLALEMHDGVAQLVATAVLQAKEAEHWLQNDSDIAHQKIGASLDLLEEALRQVRAKLFQLSPPSMRTGNLAVGIKEYLERSCAMLGLNCQFETDGQAQELESDVLLVVYRIAQESLYNVKKHANATTVHCWLAFDPTTVKLAIQDNGQGFTMSADIASLPGHLGLHSMYERAGSVGGTLTINCEPGKGTCVVLEIPVKQSNGHQSRSNIRRVKSFVD